MKNVLTILLGLAVFAGGLAGAGALAPRINRERQEQNLTVSDTVYDLPPEMAVAQAALGTFRGLAINILWERAETLKNDGKFHEAIELGKLITKLQPRYPKVWEWVSWNLAYNISAATHTPEERWIWVKSGIELLQRRGGGIDANPNELALYQQLGWIYFHKIGEYLDTMNWHYKRELADMWHSTLGAPPRSPEEYRAWLQPVIDAPEQLEALPEGAQKLARWLADGGHPFDRETLRKFTVPTRLPETTADDAPAPSIPSGPSDPDSAAAEARRQMAQIVPEMAWPDWATPQDIAATLAFVRRKTITGDELNMDPQTMLRLAERFGPIDWRHPSAHTLYWSQLGLERLKADEGRAVDNEINTKRNVLNALQTLARSGQVIYQADEKPGQSYITYLPAWNFWLAYDDYFQSDVVADPRRSSEAIEEAFGPGHRNQMDSAIADAYTFGDQSSAQQLYTRMHDRFAGTEFAAHYESPISDFAFQQLSESIDQPAVTRGLIVGLITQSITNREVYRRPREAQTQFATARRLFDEYRRLNPNPSDPLHHEVPPFEMLHINAIASFIAGNAGPVGNQQLPLQPRVAVYRQLSDEVKAVVQLQQGQELMEQARRAGFDVATLFPLPPREIMEQVARQLMGPAGDQPGGQAPQGSGARQEVK